MKPKLSSIDNVMSKSASTPKSTRNEAVASMSSAKVAASSNSFENSGASATTIEITKDYLHFSAAHFTIFSATERENLHGHNFDVSCSLDTRVGPNGLAFDYNVVKDRLMALCDELDERVLLPAQSPHLKFEHDGGYLIVRFADERIPFLERDALLLPIRNATVEEFARLFAQRLGADAELSRQPIESLNVRVSSGPGQWASCRWSRP
jgi:6-pyruvoyltetrahydropterin/6-carboxytetrahydropterin synthase